MGLEGSGEAEGGGEEGEEGVGERGGKEAGEEGGVVWGRALAMGCGCLGWDGKGRCFTLYEVHCECRVCVKMRFSLKRAVCGVQLRMVP